MFMFDEFMPDCVPELYRSRQEDADRRYDLWARRQAQYQTNRQKLAEAIASDLPILSFGGYDSCQDCPDADHDTMTADDDDICRVICRDPACLRHQKRR